MWMEKVTTKVANKKTQHLHFLEPLGLTENYAKNMDKNIQNAMDIHGF